MNFSVKIKDLEIRSCRKDLSLDLPHNTAEIIQWDLAAINHDSEDNPKKYCYTLAYWIKDINSYDLRFLGSRPFDNLVNRHHFWTLAKIGQRLLDTWSKIKK